MPGRCWILGLGLVFSSGLAGCSRDNPLYMAEGGGSSSTAGVTGTTGSVRPVTAGMSRGSMTEGQDSMDAVDTGNPEDTGPDPEPSDDTAEDTAEDTAMELPDEGILLYQSMPVPGAFWTETNHPLVQADQFCQSASNRECDFYWALMVSREIPPSGAITPLWYVNQLPAFPVFGPSGMLVAGNLEQLLFEGPLVDLVDAGVTNNPEARFWSGMGPGPMVGETCGDWDVQTAGGHAANVQLMTQMVPCEVELRLPCICIFGL